MPQATCSKPECDNKRLARGLCSAHYQRLRQGKLDDPRPIRGSVITETCTVEDCGRETYLRGWCSTHYNRWRLTGVIGGPIESRTRNKGRSCSVEACPRPAKELGFCWAHYQQQYLHGVIVTARAKGDVLLYSAVHMRLSKVRGRAADRHCVDCGLAAEDWSYDGLDPHEKRDPNNGLAFSEDLSHYEPRCRKCHRAYDAA